VGGAAAEARPLSGLGHRWCS